MSADLRTYAYQDYLNRWAEHFGVATAGDIQQYHCGTPRRLVTIYRLTEEEFQGHMDTLQAMQQWPVSETANEVGFLRRLVLLL